MKAFEISEVLSSEKKEVKVSGRALVKLKQNDEIFLHSDKKGRASLLRIIFWGEEITEIEAPHNCTLVFEPDDFFILESKYIYK